MRALLAAVAAVGLAASVQAAPMFSFETGLDGFVVDSGAGVLAQSTIGATKGTHSLSLTDGGFGQLKVDLTLAQWADVRAGKKVMFDYTIPAAMWDSWGGWWGNMNVAVNSQNGGWQQVGAQQQDVNRVAGTHSFTFDLSSLSLPAAPGNWHQMFIQHNWGQEVTANSGAPNWVATAYGPSTMYIDNISVPEPTILAGVAISSVGLMLRKRQK